MSNKVAISVDRSNRVSLPSLDQVNGRTTIEGAPSMSCNALDSLLSDDIYLGGYSCSTSSGDSSLSSSDSSSPSLSAGAKGGVAGGVIVGVLLLVLLLWYWLRQRRQRRNKGTQSKDLPAQATAPGPATVAVEKPPQYLQVPTHEAQESVPSVPRKPVGSPAAMLDGKSIYEAPIAATPVQEYHELDAGPVFGMHQRPIHPESAT